MSIEDQFDELLDEQGDIRIGTLTYSPSQVLKAVDPIAYRVGLSDFESFQEEDEDLVETVAWSSSNPTGELQKE